MNGPLVSTSRKIMSCTTSQCPCLLGHSVWVITAASFGRQRWKESKISVMRCAVEERSQLLPPSLLQEKGSGNTQRWTPLRSSSIQLKYTLPQRNFSKVFWNHWSVCLVTNKYAFEAFSVLSRIFQSPKPLSLSVKASHNPILIHMSNNIPWDSTNKSSNHVRPRSSVSFLSRI